MKPLLPIVKLLERADVFGVVGEYALRQLAALDADQGVEQPATRKQVSDGFAVRVEVERRFDRPHLKLVGGHLLRANHGVLRVEQVPLARRYHFAFLLVTRSHGRAGHGRQRKELRRIEVHLLCELERVVNRLGRVGVRPQHEHAVNAYAHVVERFDGDAVFLKRGVLVIELERLVADRLQADEDV